MIKVMVVDDSVFMRKMITKMLEKEKDIEIVATAKNGKEAKKKFTEFVNEHGLGEKTVAPTETKQMPTGEKLSAYTQSHPEFGGSEEKAKEFLRSQGYK